MRTLTRPPFLLVIILTFCQIARAEEGILVLHVTDLEGKPIAGVVLTAAGDSSVSAPTEVTKHATEISGKARIRLAKSTRPGDPVDLVLVRAPQDLIFISPWSGHVTVPCFENNTNCVAKVVLAVKGSRELLVNSQAQLAMVSQVNAANALKFGPNPPTEEQRRQNLALAAKAFGFNPEEVDQAIRGLGKKTTDPLEVGLVALYEKNYPKAIKEITLAATELKQRLEREKSKLADVQMSLGQSYYEPGLYREAVIAYQEAAELRPNDIIILTNLGLASYQAGEYAKAGQSLQLALKLTEQKPGSDQLTLATVLTGLAVLSHIALGSYAEAEPLYEQVLEILKKLYWPEHPAVATSLNNLAALYTDQRKYAKAEPLHRRALAIREKHLSPEHPDIAQSRNNLAYLYEAQGRYAEAEPLYKKALETHEKHLPPGHPNLATSLNNLAMLYHVLGEYAKAEPLARRALAIYEDSLPAWHPSVANGLNSLALICRARGKYAEAEELFKRALAINEKLYGPEHYVIARRLNNLGKLYHVQGKYTEAEPLYTRALAIYEKQLEPEHPEVAISLDNLGKLYADQGNLTKAEPLLKRALAIREKQLLPEHPDVARSLNNNAGLYLAQGKYTEAEALFKRALMIYEKQLRFEHPDVATMIQSYASLLRKTNRVAKAEAMEARARAIQGKQTQVIPGN